MVKINFDFVFASSAAAAIFPGSSLTQLTMPINTRKFSTAKLVAKASAI